MTTTPQAHKTRFVIVDAVGVTEQELVDTGTVERKRSVPLKALAGGGGGRRSGRGRAGIARKAIGTAGEATDQNQRGEIESLLDVPGAPERFDGLPRAIQRAAGCDRPGCHFPGGAGNFG